MNEDAPQAKGAPTPPAHLSEYALAVWEEIVASMPPKLYASCDSHLLSAYCTAADMHRQAIVALSDGSCVAEGQNGAPYQDPWVSILNKQAQLMATLGSRLGLDPAARASLKVPQGEKERSKFGELIGIKGGRSGS